MASRKWNGNWAYGVVNHLRTGELNGKNNASRNEECCYIYIYTYIDRNVGSYELQKILFGVYNIMVTPRL